MSCFLRTGLLGNSKRMIASLTFGGCGFPNDIATLVLDITGGGGQTNSSGSDDFHA